MTILGIPGWLFAAVAAVSLVLGMFLRRYMEGRRAREEQAHREQVREMKKRLKRDKKKAKRMKGRP